MASGIMQTIEREYAGFTPSYKKVADYLRAHQDEAQYLSISELSDACDVGKATISRFCAALGFDGYSRFKLALAHSVADRDEEMVLEVPQAARSEARIRASQAKVSAGVEPTTLLPAAERARDLLAANVAVMSQTLQTMDFAAVERSAQMLLDANSVFCLGHGGCQLIAADAWSHFLTISPKFHNVADSHLQIMTASLLDETSAILFVSFLGATRDAADVLVPARRRGAKVVLVTHYASSPAAELADEVLVCGGRETPLEGGSIIAKTSMLFAVDLLAGEYCRLAGDAALRNRDASAEALAARLL